MTKDFSIGGFTIPAGSFTVFIIKDSKVGGDTETCEGEVVGVMVAPVVEGVVVVPVVEGKIVLPPVDGVIVPPVVVGVIVPPVMIGVMVVPVVEGEIPPPVVVGMIVVPVVEGIIVLPKAEIPVFLLGDIITSPHTPSPRIWQRARRRGG